MPDILFNFTLNVDPDIRVGDYSPTCVRKANSSDVSPLSRKWVFLVNWSTDNIMAAYAADVIPFSNINKAVDHLVFILYTSGVAVVFFPRE